MASRRSSVRARLAPFDGRGVSVSRPHRDEMSDAASARPRRRGLVARGAVLAAIGGILLVAAGESAASKAARSASTFPGGAYFNLACGFSHRNNDDPIVYPGQPGRSHNHTYIGNRAVDASSTPASLRRGSTTCELDTDSSTYWVPTLYVGAEPMLPMVGVVYYVKLTSQRLSPFPADLKMVAGNPTARRAQRKDVASWSCGGIGSIRRFAAVQACTERRGARAPGPVPGVLEREKLGQRRP